MTQTFLDRLQGFVLTCWAGIHWTVGYVAAPVLFANLEDRSIAGSLAGKMFYIAGLSGVIVGAVLVFLLLFSQRAASLEQWRFWVLSLATSLASISIFVLQPMMAKLKMAGTTMGSETMAQFGKLHGVSSGIYLLASLLLASLVFSGLRTERKGPRKRTIVGDHV